MKLVAISTIGLIVAGGYMLTGRTVADYERMVRLPPERVHAVVQSELRDVAQLRFGGIMRHKLDEEGATMNFKLVEASNQRMSLTQLLGDQPQVEYHVGIAPGEQPELTRLTLAIKLHPHPGNPDARIRSEEDKVMIGAALDEAIRRVEAGESLRLAHRLRQPAKETDNPRR